MDTVTQVLEHPQYKACCETITDYEADRTYCRHDMEHFLRVGQIAILLAKENGLSIDAEEIMLAALFHDLGRALQYQNGISHAESSAILAEEVLLSIGYDPAKTDRICAAVNAIAKGRMSRFVMPSVAAKRPWKTCFPLPIIFRGNVLPA